MNPLQLSIDPNDPQAAELLEAVAGVLRRRTGAALSSSPSRPARRRGSLMPKNPTDAELEGVTNLDTVRVERAAVRKGSKIP